MKKVAVMILATFMMTAMVPAFAAEMTKEDKDQCLLASQDCKTEVDSIQKKISKLNKEIKKGTKVYTADEVKKLKAKLKDAEDFLDNMLKQ